jgi:hypothetical protein
MKHKSTPFILCLVVMLAVVGYSTNYPTSYTAQHFYHYKTLAPGATPSPDSDAYSRKYLDARFLGIGSAASNASLLQGRDTTTFSRPGDTVVKKVGFGLIDTINKLHSPLDTEYVAIDSASAALKAFIVAQGGGVSQAQLSDTANNVRSHIRDTVNAMGGPSTTYADTAGMVKARDNAAGDTFPGHIAIVAGGNSGNGGGGGGGSDTFQFQFRCTTYVSVAVNTSGDAFSSGSYFDAIGQDSVRKQTGGTGAFIAINVGAFYDADAMCALPNGKLYIGSIDDFIHKSTDNGVTWANTATKPADNFRTQLFGDANNYLYQCTGDSTIFLSTDAGATWTNLHGSATHEWHAGCADGTILYAAEWNGDIFKSTDGGTIWGALSQTHRHWTSMAADTAHTIYASVGAGDGGHDSGYVWMKKKDSTNFNESIPGHKREWRSIAVAPNKAVYGVAKDTIFKAGMTSTPSKTNLAGGQGQISAGFGTGNAIGSVVIRAPALKASGSTRQDAWVNIYWTSRGLVFPSGDTLNDMIDSGDTLLKLLFVKGAVTDTFKSRK